MAETLLAYCESLSVRTCWNETAEAVPLLRRQAMVGWLSGEVGQRLKRLGDPWELTADSSEFFAVAMGSLLVCMNLASARAQLNIAVNTKHEVYLPQLGATISDAILSASFVFIHSATFLGIGGFSNHRCCYSDTLMVLNDFWEQANNSFQMSVIVLQIFICTDRLDAMRKPMEHFAKDSRRTQLRAVVLCMGLGLALTVAQMALVERRWDEERFCVGPRGLGQAAFVCGALEEQGRRLAEGRPLLVPCHRIVPDWVAYATLAFTLLTTAPYVALSFALTSHYRAYRRAKKAAGRSVQSGEVFANKYPKVETTLILVNVAEAVAQLAFVATYYLYFNPIFSPSVNYLIYASIGYIQYSIHFVVPFVFSGLHRHEYWLMLTCAKK